MKVKFYDQVEDSLLTFAVIISKYHGNYVFCKHKERDTFEVPGGHREPGEDIETTARRELNEETSATQFDIKPISVYSYTGVNKAGQMEETFGMLYFAEIYEMEKDLHFEIEKVVLSDKLPERWTYSEIQPILMEEAKKRGFI